MQRTWKRAEINTKRCARSDRATQSSASMNLSPCENSTHIPLAPVSLWGVCSRTFPSAAAQFSWTTDAAVLVIPISPPQCTKEILRNHLVKNCQSPAPHLDSESYGYLRHMELPQHHSKQANTIILQRWSLILKSVQPKWKQLDIFILRKHGHSKLLSLLLFFVLLDDLYAKV